MGEAMTTNQTIDGVLISRELLERILSYAWFPSGDVTVFDLRLTDREKLRALLDAPDVLVVPLTGPKEWVDSLKPSAQPQGEPVAWLAQAVGKGGEVYRNKASTNEPTMRDIEIAWGQGVIDRFTIVIKPLYAEQPAPVAVHGEFLDTLPALADNEKAQALLSRPTRWAKDPAPVVHTMRSVMEAICKIDGFPVLTSNQCHALAVKLNDTSGAKV